ncbi:hypothetical protein V2G26_013425 [Clonostachys chloroleuca]
MAPTSIALILGSGPRVGASVAKALSGKGYQVAIASRHGTGTKNSDGYLSLKADFTNPESIAPLFEAVKKEFHASPNVVVYNAASLTIPPDEDSILSIPFDTVASDLNVNTISPYVAAQQAIHHWKELPSDIKKTFIYTGNILNVSVIPAPRVLDLGMGKAASAFWVGVADASYAAKGFRFFYTDERKSDGQPVSTEIDGDAHSEFYLELITHEGQIPWHATFVKDQGYVQFK